MQTRMMMTLLLQELRRRRLELQLLEIQEEQCGE
jgi:hypothetical protein